jgi:hypothetical protein
MISLATGMTGVGAVAGALMPYASCTEVTRRFGASQLGLKQSATNGNRTRPSR